MKHHDTVDKCSSEQQSRKFTMINFYCVEILETYKKFGAIHLCNSTVRSYSRQAGRLNM